METMGNMIMEYARNRKNYPCNSTLGTIEMFGIHEGCFIPQNGDLNSIANTFNAAISIIRKEITDKED